MTETSDHHPWQAVALSGNLSAKPLSILVDDRPVVLFRDETGAIRALHDRCPHRHAPLSGGKVVSGSIECPYHGWRFNGRGELAAMPCLTGDLPRISVPAYSVTEREGVIFLSRRPGPEPYVFLASGKDTIAMKMENRVRSTVLDVAENILDATHTHFTHKGILRGLSDKRYRVHVTVTAGPGWVEAVYEGEPRQEGLVSKLLEGQRGKGVARFLAPGIAELEFWGKNRLNLSTTFHLRQETRDTVHGVAILAGPRQAGLGYLKAAMLRPFFKIALRQDQAILEASVDNAARFGNPACVVGPLDILRTAISEILEGKTPTMAGTSVKHEMEL